MSNTNEQSIIWDYFKPRHTHTWNMLQIAAQHLVKISDPIGFEIEYAWENLIIRLTLYRNAVKILSKLSVVEDETNLALNCFDSVFTQNGKNSLIALRNMFEHYDDYAAGLGHGHAKRDIDLDPWRSFDVAEYNRGRFKIHFVSSMEASNNLRSEALEISDRFIQWYKNENSNI